MKMVACSLACHAISGVLVGYIVFIDEGKHFDWPVWLWWLAVVSLVTLFSSRFLAHAGRPAHVRVSGPLVAAAFMVATAVVLDFDSMLERPIPANIVAVFFLLVICNVYFLPSWIGALLPARRVAGVPI